MDKIMNVLNQIWAIDLVRFIVYLALAFGAATLASWLVTKLLKVYSDYTGDHSGPKCIGGGTYAKMIPNTLAFGPIFPGDEVREHKPDEYMEISRLLDNAKILADAMYELAN